MDDDVVHQKEREWRDVLRAKFDASAATLKCREAEITRLKEERLVLEHDFKYNLGLLAGRDSELDRFEAQVETLSSDILAKTEQLTNVRMKLDNANLALRHKHLEVDDARQLFEKTVGEKDKLIMDLKCQLETASKKWVDQLESERATYRWQLMKLDGDAQKRSASIDQKYSNVIEEKDLQHKHDVERLTTCLKHEHQHIKQLTQDLHTCKLQIVKLEADLATAEARLAESNKAHAKQLEKLQSSLNEHESAITLATSSLKDAEAKLAAKEEEAKTIYLEMRRTETQRKCDAARESLHVNNNNTACMSSLHLTSSGISEEEPSKGPAASSDGTVSVIQLQQQNFVMRQVIKDMKRKLADLPSKPTTDHNKDELRSTCKQCPNPRESLRCSSTALPNTVTPPKATEHMSTCGEYDSEDDNRVRKLEETVGKLKTQMLQAMRDKIQGSQWDGNEDGMSLGDVQLMLLEEKLDKVTENIGKAVALDKKELLNEMLNIKRELVETLKKIKNRDSEEFRNDGHNAMLKSEEMLAKVRNEISHLESKFDNLATSQHVRPVDTERNWGPQLVPERLHSCKQAKINEMCVERERLYSEVPSFMTNPGSEDRLSRMQPVASPAIIHNPRSSSRNFEPKKYVTAKKSCVRHLKVRNNNIQDYGA